MAHGAPFPFIVGCGRSAGLATGLQAWDRPEGFAWPLFVASVLAHPRVARWRLDRGQVITRFRDHPPSDYAAAVRLLFEAYAGQQGKTRYGDKTPGYVHCLPLLAARFPEGRFVHVVRDGRDTALALLATSWGYQTAAQAAPIWRDAVFAGRRFGEAHPDRYLELRYERLVADAEGELVRLCSFLDLPFDRAMLDHGASADRWLAMSPYPEFHRNLHLPPNRPLRDWRREMPPGDVARFEAVAGDALRAFGYPTGEGPGRASARALLRRAKSVR